ncbi:hypothetical protein BH11PSE12_BH11PSE12_31210 [soil metagenome]
MLSLLRSAPFTILVSYTFLSALPFFSVLLGMPVERPLHLLTFEALSWLALWALIGKPRWFHWLLLPAFLAVPIEIYLRLYFGQGISTHHLGIIAETSPKEALEFLGSKVWWLLLISIAVVTWWWSLVRLCRQTSELDWSHGSRWLVLATILSACGVWAYGEEIGTVKAATPRTERPIDTQHTQAADDGYLVSLQRITAGLPKLPSWVAIPYDYENYETFARTWPFGLVLRGVDFWAERNYLSKLSEQSQQFRFRAFQPAASDLPQTIVMVIGESSRFDRWSLNGYQRNTNPLLEQESNLVSFSDVTTAVAATRLSVPIIVSRKPAAQSLKAGFSEKSFLSAFKEAGFKTFWLSNQMSFGEFDTPTSVFANEADVTQFLNLGGFTNTSNYDQVLLEPMQNAMHDSARKKLIVLHTLGNHWNYSHRHPKAYDKWQPSLFGVDNPVYTDLSNKQALNNSYDNSILYTDSILAQVITQLKAGAQISAMLYVSDHGQTLYDGSCHLAFHGHNTQYEFHIPALMWFSDRYQTSHEAKIKQLYKHKDARLSTENVFHSLLDMADIRYPGERLEWSFLSPRLKAHTRYVDSYGWTDYDNASFKGDCREVMDKKTPLAQEK